MSKPSGLSVFLLLLLSLNVATTLVEGQLVKWNLANFSSSLPAVRSLVLLDDATIVNTTGPPRLILNSELGVATVGRVVYSSKVQFRDVITRIIASFSTNFTFAVANPGVSTAGCGGFTFHIRGDNSSVGESGKYLGLTTAANDGAEGNSLFAVEFDTARDVDVGDPSVTHIGLDVNGVKSRASYDLCPSIANCTNLVNNGVFLTKIAYSATKDSLNVELYWNTTTLIANWTTPKLDLHPILQEYMYVGFSGSNGVGCNQTHTIFSWGFSTSRPSSDSPGSDAGEEPPANVSYDCYRFDGCRNYKALIIGVPAAVGGCALVFLILCIYFCCYRKKQKSQDYAAVENDPKSGPPTGNGDSLNLANKAVKPDVEAAAAHKLPAPPVQIALSMFKAKEKTETPIAPGQSVAASPNPALFAATTTKAVEPKLVVPVAEPVNRNAEEKVTMTCCVQPRHRRDYKEPVVFSLKELAQATKYFSVKEVIGGTPERRPVFKGVLRDNGTVVAIKEITLDNISDEFVSKAMVLGRIRHPNLVHLLGWCKCPEKAKLYLVYDYMPKGSLDKLLLLDRDADGFLGFDARYNVLVGVSAGLTYLHEEWEQCVLHRDVKPSNVLLDAMLNAHLGNFSHATLVDHDRFPESTVMDGTLGYMAPELPFTGKPTVKSDAFSFGILALAVACGRLPLDWQMSQEDRVLLDCVWRAHEEGDLLRVADKRLEKTFTEKQMITLLHVGLYCAHPDPSMRPNMAFVWHILVGRAKVPELPAKKPVVENYAALNSLGLMRNSVPRPVASATSSDTQRRFSGMEIS